MADAKKAFIADLTTPILKVLLSCSRKILWLTMWGLGEECGELSFLKLLGRLERPWSLIKRHLRRDQQGNEVGIWQKPSLWRGKFMGKFVPIKDFRNFSKLSWFFENSNLIIFPNRKWAKLLKRSFCLQLEKKHQGCLNTAKPPYYVTERVSTVFTALWLEPWSVFFSKALISRAMFKETTRKPEKNFWVMFTQS